MTGTEALRYYAAGRRIRQRGQEGWYAKDQFHSLPIDWLLATDWELVEEPEERKACEGCGYDVCECLIAARATITRLTRELAEMTKGRDFLMGEHGKVTRNFHALRGGLRGVLEAASEKP